MNKVWIITLVSALGIQSAAAQTANNILVTKDKNVSVVQEINPSAQVYKGSFAERKAAFRKSIEERKLQINERKKQVEEEEKKREELLSRLAAEKAADGKSSNKNALDEEYFDKVQVRPMIKKSKSEFAPNEEKTEKTDEVTYPSIEVNSTDDLLKEIETLRQNVERLNKSGDELVKENTK